MIQTEVRRQSLHIILGCAYILITLLLPKQFALLAITGIFTAGFCASLFHMKISPIPFVERILGNVERKHEKKFKGVAALNFTLAVIISSIVFFTSPKIILVGALLVLTFGDGFSTLAGKMFGRTKVAGKTLEGTLGGIAAGFAALFLAFPPDIAIITATAGMLAEFLPIDDNYTIPLVSGAVLFCFFNWL